MGEAYGVLRDLATTGAKDKKEK